MIRTTFILASIFAMTAVMLGAFGAHALKGSLSAGQLSTYEIGVRYQYFHAMAIFIVGILAVLAQETKFNVSNILLKAAICSFTLGIFTFSGSLYLLACRDLFSISSWTWLGPLTPLGGILLIIGWGTIFLSVVKK